MTYDTDFEASMIVTRVHLVDYAEYLMERACLWATAQIFCVLYMYMWRLAILHACSCMDVKKLQS